MVDLSSRQGVIIIELQYTNIDKKNSNNERRVETEIIKLCKWDNFLKFYFCDKHRNNII